MKNIEVILGSLLLLTLASITEGSGKLDLTQKDFSNTYKSTSSIPLLDVIDKNIINEELDYSIEKSDSLEPWVQIPINLDALLFSVLFINENVGFAVGLIRDYNDTVLFTTTDGGLNWTRYPFNVHLPILSITSIDTTTLIGVGGGFTGVAFESLIIKSTNQGITWARINIPEQKFFQSVAFRPNGTGIIVGDMNMVYKTTNSGLTWNSKHLGTHWDQCLNDVYFLDSVQIIAVGNLGHIILSTDSGNSWEYVNSSTTRNLYAVEHIDGKLFVVGQYGTMLFSTDSGRNWQSQQSGTTADLLGIDFTNSSNGYIVGGRNTIPGINVILQTIDGGNTWEIQNHSVPNIFNDVFFINEQVGWIAGEHGTILKTTNGGVTFIEDEENNSIQPKQFLLQQNSPNPFNPSTSIQYAISSTQFVTLKVYDLLGREVVTLVNEEKPAGSYEIDFQSTVGSHQLANGVYFYQLQAGDFVETKKMILLK